MTKLMEAMQDFWAQFGIPAYLQGVVPPDAAMPYITYTVTRAAALNVALMTAYNWHSARLMGNTERARVADSIADAIPECGVRIRLPGGGFVILRRGSDFQTTYEDPDDADAIAIRTSVEVYFYMT